mgnify:CR=1 FL=1
MRPALLRMATRYLEDSDDAEDVVQDVLLKLWFLRGKLDKYRSVDALAIVITKHLCINCIRGARIEKVAEENMQEILDSISTLPNLQQAILRMKHIEGFEVEEIARMTGSTPVAVRTNLSRARKKVREQFMIHNR